MKNHIVVWDPEGKYQDGAILESPQVAQLKARGVVTLPVDPSLFPMSGIGGFFKRSWGEGMSADHQVPRHFCPMAIFMLRAHRVIHWAARIVPDRKTTLVGGAAPDDPGTITIGSVASRANTFQASLTPKTNAVRIRDYGPIDAHGGWTIGGYAQATVTNDGNHSFALYGVGRGVRVAWAALSAVQD